MKSPAKIIAERIALIPIDVADSFFTWDIGTNFFIGNEPDNLEFCGSAFDTGGVEQNPKLNDEMSTVQIRVKSSRYEIGYNRLQKIRLALEGIDPYSNGTDTINGIWVQAPVTFIGLNKANYPIFTLNLRVLHTPANAGHRQNY